MTSPFTVVMLNWKRPGNVSRLVLDYAKLEGVAEVIVMDNAPTPETSVPALSQLPNIKYIAAVGGRDLGLASRFAAAALARTEAVFMADDDIEMPAETVQGLRQRWENDRRSLVGLFGRRLESDGGYNVRNAYGRCAIVLTRAVFAARYACALAVGPTMKMAAELGGVPAGNGEDIVLSRVADLRNLDRGNLAVALPYVNISFDDEHAISVRYPDHLAHRTAVAAWCGRLNATILAGV